MIPIISAALGLAPVLSRWIGGEKAGEVAEKVSGVVTALTGQSDPMAGLKVIETDPTLLVEFQRKAMELDLQLWQAEIDDRKNARKNAVEMAEHGDYTARNIAYIVVGGFMLMLAFLIIGAFLNLNGLRDQAIMSIVTMAFGALSAKTSNIIDYFFGTSASSQRKTNKLFDRLDEKGK